MLLKGQRKTGRTCCESVRGIKARSNLIVIIRNVHRRATFLDYGSANPSKWAYFAFWVMRALSPPAPANRLITSGLSASNH